jgi:predicted cupin superfamily sugar epimerase
MRRLELQVDELKELLGLKPHPQEGGWYVRTYESAELVPAENFADRRYDGRRRTSTAIYYLLEPETFSEMHLLQSDEIFHFYAGDAVEMLQLLPDGTGKRIVIGREFAAGERPQVVVERGIWQGSKLVPGGAWALLGCTVSPGFEFVDYSEGKRPELIARWPEWAEMIAGLTRKPAGP